MFNTSFTYIWHNSLDYFEKNYPKKDTLLSKNHLVYYDGKWYHPYLSQKFKQIHLNKVDYFHLILDSYDHNILLDTGLEVESLTSDFQLYKERITCNIDNYKLNTLLWQE